MAGFAALEDLVLPTMEVELPDGNSFSVRGFSLQDVTQLLTQNGPVMEDFFARFRGQSDTDISANPMTVGLELLAQAPGLVAEIIAMAADAPHLKDKIRKLPLTTQQDALQKIASVTFDASGGPKKFAEAVLQLVSGTTNLMSGLSR